MSGDFYVEFRSVAAWILLAPAGYSSTSICATFNYMCATY